jgi:hypothetical protein
MTTRQTTRRAILAGAASASVAVVQPGAVRIANAKPIAGLAALDKAATIRRAQKIVDVLGGRYVREGWNEAFDKERAAKFLEAVRSEDYTADNDPAGAVVSAWMRDHNQSFDWLYSGNPGVMLCGAAAQSPAAAAIAVAPVAAEQRLFEIEKEVGELGLKIKAVADEQDAFDGLIRDQDVLFEEAVDIRPLTLSGIHCKARLARAWDPKRQSMPTELADSLVDDLLAMQEVQS